jgi:nitroimidazol reductase NimA-like FMN-containing flavoprotein (pyridoxamine 5'-phosphate oxidase superfamily)
MSTTTFEKTKRNRVLRLPERGHYEREEVYRIVDAALYCHVAFVQDGQPLLIPTLHARDGDTLLLHGSSASRMIRHAGAGQALCVVVTHIDGIVLARSIFHHSLNYRSAVLFGQGEPVSDPEQKLAALVRFSERIMPGRWDDARPPNRKELKATGVIAMPIESASAKVRSGPPKDDAEDMALPVWAGVVPFQQVAGDPLADPAAPAVLPLPEYLRAYLDQQRGSA